MAENGNTTSPTTPQSSAAAMSNMSANVTLIPGIDAADLAKSDLLQEAYGEWLETRAKISKPSENQSDEAISAAFDRRDELEKLLTTTPSVFPWMIIQKVEILENCLASGNDCWANRREIVMLAGIKADLLRARIEFK